MPTRYFCFRYSDNDVVCPSFGPPTTCYNDYECVDQDGTFVCEATEPIVATYYDPIAKELVYAPMGESGHEETTDSVTCHLVMYCSYCAP